MTLVGLLVFLLAGLVVSGLVRVLTSGRPVPTGLAVVVGLAVTALAALLASAYLSNSTVAATVVIAIVLAWIGLVNAVNRHRGHRLRAGPEPVVVRPVVAGPEGSSTSHPFGPADPPRVSPPPPPSRVFVSYRRTDGGGHAAGRIVDHLRGRLGPDQVFIDIDSLPVGTDFVDGVLRAIRGSAVVLVLVGDQWLTACDERGHRRLDDPADIVRMEIENALRLGKPVLPVLVNGAAMPRADQLPGSLAVLPRLNGIRLDHESWRADVERLTHEVTRLRP